MISIKGLIKIYETGGSKSTALNDVTMTLPSAGMVFITGESGSGKSTLLNILGGLDSASYGEVSVDGNTLNRLSEKELVLYRSSYVGFVFQDYCLINDLTVYDNVRLSLDIGGESDTSKVDEVLAKVGLSEFKSKHPNQLSGGQQQRVAIARALIKNPKLMLCDEPTGNLDSENSRQILTILRELSKDRLIVIVSHSQEDARHFADRIITLKDGNVVSDYENDLSSSYLIEDGTLYVSNINALSEDELNKINADMGSIKAIKPLNRLSNAKEVSEEEKKAELTAHKYKNSLKTGGAFLKHGLVSLLLISAFSGLLVSTQGMVQNLTDFNTSSVIEETLKQNNETVFAMKKGYYNTSGKTKSNYISPISDEDKSAIENSAYKDEAYQLVNYSMPISLTTNTLIRQGSLSNSSNLKSLYANESYGVLVTNTDYVTSLFGKFNLLAGSLDDQPSYGIYITDYLADSIFHFQTDYTAYSDLIGEYSYIMTDSNRCCYISGVIETGYKEKYQDVIDEYTAALAEGDISITDKLEDSKEYTELLDKITSMYGMAYSFNSNFINDCKDINARSFTRLDRITVSGTLVGKKQEIKVGSANVHQASDAGVTDLAENSVLMSTAAINALLGTNYTYSQIKLLMPLSGTITGYSAVSYAKNDVKNYSYKIDVTIDVKNYSATTGDAKKYGYIVSDDLFDKLQDLTIFPYAYHFSDIEHAQEIYDMLKDSPYVPISPYASAAYNIGSTMEAYNTVFILIAVLLSVIAFALIIAYGVTIINKHKHDIGILKALGAKDSDIMKIFLCQIGASAVTTSLVSLICGLALTKVMDKIIIAVIHQLMDNSAIVLVSILKINPLVLLIDVLMIIALTMIGAVIPFLMMRKIRPIQIIRNNK